MVREKIHPTQAPTSGRCSIYEERWKWAQLCDSYKTHLFYAEFLWIRVNGIRDVQWEANVSEIFATNRRKSYSVIL